jgi:predicted O-methyltransferase YrrM
MAAKKKVKKEIVETKENILITEAPEKHPWNNEIQVCEFIASLVKLNNSKNVLEIGVFEGETTKEILKSLSKDSKYTGIDIKDYRSEELKSFMTEDQFNLIDSIKFLKSKNRETFDFVFVDGEHSWAYLMQEFRAIENVITQNAIIVYYNTLHLEGPRKLIQYASHYKYKAVTLNTSEGRGLSILHK